MTKPFTPPQTETIIIVKLKGQAIIEMDLWTFFVKATTGFFRRMSPEIVKDTEIEIKTRFITYFVKKPQEVAS